jgi:hypothetical protein
MALHRKNPPVTTREKVSDLFIAMGFGLVGSALIWWAGAPELSWLPFVVAGTTVATSPHQSHLRACRPRRRQP